MPDYWKIDKHLVNRLAENAKLKLSDIEIEKLRFGGKNQDRKGRVAIIPTVGVSPELTAAFDAFATKKARRQAGTGMVQFQKDGEWQNAGLLKDLIKELLDGKRDSFAPFFEILRNQKE